MACLFGIDSIEATMVLLKYALLFSFESCKLRQLLLLDLVCMFLLQI